MPTDHESKIDPKSGDRLPILIWLVATHDPAVWMIWLFPVATAARFVHAAGYVVGTRLNPVHPLRKLGAFITYACGLVLASTLIF